MVVNDNEELFVYGTTASNDFPITAGAYDATFGGGLNVTVTYVIDFPNGSDIYVSKFDAGGGSLLGSTFVGGSQNDGLNTGLQTSYNYGDHARGEIILDGNGDPIVASCTFSSDFPATAGALQGSLSGDPVSYTHLTLPTNGCG